MFDFDSVSRKFYSEDQLIKIKNTKIAIAGCGGLGSNCAMLLVRAGFVNFSLVDFDTIELSNLNRQFYRYNQIGLSKVRTLKNNLLEINPNLNIATLEAKIEDSNIDSFIDGADIVVEAFDKAEDKAMISTRMFADPRPFVCVSGIAGFGDSDRIVTKKINNNWVIGDGISGVESAPPLAPAVMIAAAKEADVVLSIVLNND